MLCHAVPAGRNEEIQAIRQLPAKDINEHLMKSRYNIRVSGLLSLTWAKPRAVRSGIDYIGLTFYIDNRGACELSGVINM